MLAVSAPPRVAALLRATPDGPVRVLHRGPHAVYVAVLSATDERVVGVVDAAAVAVPCALRVAGTSLPEARTARVDTGRLLLDEVALEVGRFVDVAVPRIASPTVPGDAPAVVPMTPEEVQRLVGAGEGLTPYGDDVLCGWLATSRALGVPTPEVDASVRALLPRTTALSATLLRCALAGEALPQLGAFLTALGTPDEAARAADLRAVGHTSGAGLLAGARRALAEVTTTTEDAA